MSYWRDLPLYVRISVAYFLFGLAWIITSDSIVQVVATTQRQHAWFQTYKGIGFIALSTGLIAWFVYNESRRRSIVRRLLDELVSLAPDPILVRKFHDEEIVQANERFAEEVGLPRAEIIDSSLSEMGLAIEKNRQAEIQARLARDGEALNYRQTIETRDGDSTELLVSSRRIDFGAQEYVCTVAKDITQLEKAYDETIRAWARALELRDDETFAHTLRVTRATVVLAEQLGLQGEALVHIRRGALLHDIGKIGVPDSILLKDGELTDEEWTVVRKHPVLAYELLSQIDYLEPAIDIPYRHHEKWDGSGYPGGLAGEEIPLAARIFAVVDVWDALRSERPYRDAWEPQQVLDHLEAGKGSHFQPELVEAFFELGADRRQQLRQVDTEAILG